MTKLRLIAQNEADISVLASAVQDAILRVGDIRYDPNGRYMSLRISRYRHEASKPSRVEAGLRIDGVMNLQSRGIDRSNPEALAVLLDASYEAVDAVAGTLTLTFAGGGAFKVDVEAVDMTLADVGDPRATKYVPAHGD